MRLITRPDLHSLKQRVGSSNLSGRATFHWGTARHLWQWRPGVSTISRSPVLVTMPVQPPAAALWSLPRPERFRHQEWRPKRLPQNWPQVRPSNQLRLRLTIDRQRSRNGSEAPVGAPEQYAFQCRRRQQMYIDPANTSTHEAMSLDERHRFLILHDPHGWQSSEQLQDLSSGALSNHRPIRQ